MKALPIPFLILALISLSLSGCESHAEAEPEHEEAKIVATSPMIQDVVITEQYVCQIHSRRHIEIRAMVDGYLEEILVKEGQEVKAGQPMFKILRSLYQADLDAKRAEVRSAEVELEQSRSLLKDKVVSQVDVALHEAKLANAQAEAKRAETELGFTDIAAKYDGIVDRLYEQQGSLVDKGDMLTTLSDNHLMWVYFNVPEAQYLEYMAGLQKAKEKAKNQAKDDTVQNGQFGAVSRDKDDQGNRNAAAQNANPDQNGLGQDVALRLADGSMFPHIGKIATIEAQFNNETGNIPFRADFPNPERLLRHGQTGTVLINKTLPDVLVIPQRATFEILDQLYVFVIDDAGVAHQHPIEVEHELEDVFVVKGLDAKDKIVIEGIRQIHDGQEVEKYDVQKPEDALADLKFHAE